MGHVTASKLVNVLVCLCLVAPVVGAARSEVPGVTEVGKAGGIWVGRLAREVGAYELATKDGPKRVEGGSVRAMVAVVDLSDPRVRLKVTDGSAGIDPSTLPVPPQSAGGQQSAGPLVRLVTVGDWAEKHGLVLAVNANFFGWVREPDGADGKRGKILGARVLGWCVDGGEVLSPARRWKGETDPALVVLKDRTAKIVGPGQPAVDEREVLYAVAGIGGGESDATPGTLLVRGGKNLGETARVDPRARHPRTAVGVNENGRLIVLVVDGRQPGWSVGATLPELGSLMVELGAVDAVALDGGGSSTFVFAPPGGDRVSNRPSDGSEDVKTEGGRQRAVAVQLGFAVEGVGR